VSKIKFVLSLITSENDYQREQAKAAEAAARRLNVDLEILYADNDSVTQSSQLLDIIHKYKSELNGILVEPAGGTEFPQVGNAAVNAGVAWVILNRGVASLAGLRRKSLVPSFAVSSDHTEVGHIQARQLAAILPHGGSVLCIQGPASSPVSQQRLVGLQAERPDNVILKIVKSSNWTEEGGYHAVSSWLKLSTSRQQPIYAVVGQNDSIALGARRAFEDAKAAPDAHQNWSNLPFLGVDGLPKTGQAWVAAGSLMATVVVPAVAGPALEIAVKAIAGKTQPPDLHLVPARSFPSLDSLRPIATTPSRENHSPQPESLPDRKHSAAAPFSSD
jgi:ribose transport system substrate-binding protein